jgi:predicted dienelactone hydrolase
MLNMVAHCAHHLEDDIGFCLNGVAGQPWAQTRRKVLFFFGRFLNEDNAPSKMTLLHGGYSPIQNQDPRPDPRIKAVSLVVPLSVIFTPESLSRIAIPVALTTADQDEVLVPRFHSDKLLKYCKSCSTLSAHPNAGHFDWLSPWPASVASRVASTQIRGGLPNPTFSKEARQKAFDQIALFFKQKI